MNNLFDITSYNLPLFSVKTEYMSGYYSEQDEEIDNFQDNLDNEIQILFDQKNYNSIRIEVLFKQTEIDKLKNPIYLNRNTSMQDEIKGFLKDLQGKNLLRSFTSFTLSDTDTSTPDIDFFNQQSYLEDKINSYIVKTSKKSQDRILNSYNIRDQSRFDTDNNFKQYSVSNKYIQDIFMNKSKSNFSNEENMFVFFKSLDENEISDRVNLELISNSLNIEGNLDQFIRPDNPGSAISDNTDRSSILEKIKYFYHGPLTEETLQEINSKNGSLFVGFLIKKHIKRRDGSLILNSSNHFLYIDIENMQNKTVFFDINTSYGNFYSYELIPVFYLSLCKNNDDDSIERYYYLMCQNSYHCDFIKSAEYNPPEPPGALRAKYLYNSKKTLLEWDFPPNPEGDVIGYQVYRRKNLDEPYKLIKVFMKKDPSKFRNFDLFSDKIDESLIEVSKSGKEIVNYFEDETDNLNDLNIYTVCSIDAHGMVSNYSNQIAVRYSIIYNKMIVDNISLSGAPRQYPNLYIQRKSMLFENDNLLFNFTPFFKNKEKIKIYFTPDCSKIKTQSNQEITVSDFSNSDFHLNLVRLTDLQTKNIVFNFKIN